MWDDEGNEALFDQSGDFWDQEDYERFVEEYTPLASLHPDEFDDVANSFNVDFERIGDGYVGDGVRRFPTDFEERISSVWHSHGFPGMQTFKTSIDPLVRALIRHYYRHTDDVFGNGHPETCGCPECVLLYRYPEYEIRHIPSDERLTRPQPDNTDTDFQFSSRASRTLPAPAVPADLPHVSNDATPRFSTRDHTATGPGEPKRSGWFARLMRPWTWLSRKRS